jgi:hypothetical protein
MPAILRSLFRAIIILTSILSYYKVILSLDTTVSYIISTLLIVLSLSSSYISKGYTRRIVRALLYFATKIA